MYFITFLLNEASTEETLEEAQKLCYRLSRFYITAAEHEFLALKKKLADRMYKNDAAGRSIPPHPSMYNRPHIQNDDEIVSNMEFAGRMIYLENRARIVGQARQIGMAR